MFSNLFTYSVTCHLYSKTMFRVHILILFVACLIQMLLECLTNEYSTRPGQFGAATDPYLNTRQGLNHALLGNRTSGVIFIVGGAHPSPHLIASCVTGSRFFCPDCIRFFTIEYLWWADVGPQPDHKSFSLRKIVMSTLLIITNVSLITVAIRKCMQIVNTHFNKLHEL